MKRFFSLLMVISLTLSIYSQPPQKMSFQTVIRNASGGLVTNHAVGMRISILQESVTGTAVYVETHTATTNANGLATIEIGGGTIISGTFSGINWSAGLFFLKTETDPAGGTSYTITGTSQLLSVPYALYARDVQNKDDSDADPINEIQTLSISSNNLTLSKGGGTVAIPGDNWGTQKVSTDATLTGNGTTEAALKIADNGVTTAKILDGTISTSDLAGLSVATSKIADNAVTVAKLPTGATADKYLRGDGTWATPATGIITETDPTWSGNANETVDIGRTGKVGIGTTTPAALLHVNGVLSGGGNVVFTGLMKTISPGIPAVSGAGTRLMWYPDKAAFRAGQVDGTQWDATNTGTGSSGLGYNVVASGQYATAMGFNSVAASYGSVALGQFNKGGGSASSWVATDPLFEIGIGRDAAFRKNALTVLKNGNIGIGTETPESILHIADNSTATSPHLLLTENADDYARLMFKNTASPTRNWTISGYLQTTDPILNKLNFNFYDGSSYNDILSINGYGRVGINMTDPPNNLSVMGSAISIHNKYCGVTFSDGLLVSIEAASSNPDAYIINKENGDLTLGTNATGRITIASGGNIGIGDVTPNASLDVEGSMVVGSMGKVFNEIREITGTTTAAGQAYTLVNYPSGYNNTNTRILSVEVQISTTWVTLGKKEFSEEFALAAGLQTDNIVIYHPDITSYHSKPFRILLMKVQ